MVREDIIRMARGALIFPTQEKDDNGTGMWATFTVYKSSIESLEKFAALVAAAEREACAQILDHNANACANNSVLRDVLQGNATAIRARGSND